MTEAGGPTLSWVLSREEGGLLGWALGGETEGDALKSSSPGLPSTEHASGKISYFYYLRKISTNILACMKVLYKYVSIQNQYTSNCVEKDE